jgi:hypothetical protein
MPEDLKMPGKAKVPKKAVYVGAGLAGLILAYSYYKKRSVGATATGTGTNAYDPNAIDPATGMTYADEQSMGMGTYGNAGFGSGSGGPVYLPGSGWYDPSTGQLLGNPPGGTGGTTPPTTYSNNAQWATAAQAWLVANKVSAALSISAITKALLGQPMTANEVRVFGEARAFLGEPPSHYPPIHQVPDKPPGPKPKPKPRKPPTHHSGGGGEDGP